MNRIKSNESGFSVVEIVMVIVIVGLIGAVGYLVYKNQHKVNNAIKKTVTSQARTSKTLSVKSQNLSPVDTAKVLTNFYNQYIAMDNSSGNLVRDKLDALVKQYGTQNLVSYQTPPTGYIYNVDPITCSGMTPPTSVTVSQLQSTATSAHLIVQESFDANNKSINSTVILQNGILKIDSITCSPPVTPELPF
jgi:type II secretory pathway pseudopilin PulG